jgi:hypothetical protein
MCFTKLIGFIKCCMSLFSLVLYPHKSLLNQHIQIISVQ